jgi:hypothetical protein
MIGDGLHFELRWPHSPPAPFVGFRSVESTSNVVFCSAKERAFADERSSRRVGANDEDESCRSLM